MNERKIQIVSLNFITGEIGYRVNDVELNYLVYVDPADMMNQSVINQAIQDHLATFEPFTAEMLSTEPVPQIDTNVPANPPSMTEQGVVEI